MNEKSSLPSREQELLSIHLVDLQSMGYLDSQGRPIGLGTHLVPLFLKTLETKRAIIFHNSEMINLEDGDAPSIDYSQLFQDFYKEIHKTTETLQKAGYHNAPDLAFELILPQMDFLFCTHYAYWSAMMSAFDVITVDSNALDENNPNDLRDTLRAFLQVAEEKKAKWSIEITKKSLNKLGW